MAIILHDWHIQVKPPFGWGHVNRTRDESVVRFEFDVYNGDK